MEDLKAAQERARISLGFLKPREVVDVRLVERPAEEAVNFEEKIKRLRSSLAAKDSQLNFFEQTVPQEVKRLTFQRHRISVKWFCYGTNCKSHDMQVLDWEVGELQRKVGPEKALDKVRSLCNLAEYNTCFYLGNLFLHPTSFLIVGLWYPKKANLLF